MTAPLTEKVILITGASGGIGLALARRFANNGNTLLLLARRADELALVGARAFPCDVSNRDEVAEVFKKIRTMVSRIDIAILNAGIGTHNSIRDFDLTASAAMFHTNVFGVLNCINEIVPGMLERGGGVIAGVSSMADVRGFPGSAVYCATKAALSTLLEGFRVELKQKGIDIITIKPGFVRTAMTARNTFHMPFLMSAEQAADIIYQGIAKRKRVIRFPLRMAMLIAILRYMPSRLYERLAALDYQKRNG